MPFRVSNFFALFKTGTVGLTMRVPIVKSLIIVVVVVVYRVAVAESSIVVEVVTNAPTIDEPKVVGASLVLIRTIVCSK